MYGEFKIGDQTIHAVANAATPYRFKTIHNMDLVKYQYRMLGLTDETIDDMTEVNDYGLRLGYTMAMQADEHTDITKCNEESYLEWLSSFTAFDAMTAVGNIWAFYSKQSGTTSELKKKDGSPAVK